MTLRLCDEVGVEEVEQQIVWFDEREHGWAKKGLGAAFVAYCRRRAPEPERLGIERRRRQEMRDERKRKREEQQREQSDREASAAAFEALSEQEIEACREIVRQKLRLLPLSEDGAIFRGALGAEVRRIAREKQERTG